MTARQGLFVSLMSVLILFSACQKEVTGGDEMQAPTAQSRLYRIQQGTTNDINIDTIWNITYAPDGNMKSVIDSVYQDSLTATFDASGKIIQLNGTYGDKVNFLYNPSGQLTEVSMAWGSSKEKYVFSYENGVISKKTLLTDAIRPGEMLVWRDYVYTVQNGNITGIEVYDKNGTFLGTETRSYGNEVNQLKALSFFNYAGQMGTSQLIDWETYFSKNLVTGVSSQVTGYESYTLNTTYTIGSQQQVSKAIMKVSSGDTYTWQFFYK